ncbi:MAG: ATP-binding cassette domain-containing protein [Bacilli bacterium]|nr:ATP-binding cassette domain-containing protein [Bacilli bacterium]
MAYIQIENVTKDYQHGRGIFDVNLEIQQGEVFGYLGPNGAGKTTTIRNLLGFIKPDQGTIRIEGKDTWREHYATNAEIGYLPGEINFPSSMTGEEVLKWNASLKNVHDLTAQNELIEYFELRNLKTKVKRMSKGMKQKLGIICAFMNDPKILVLDEPTSGLDPLMQDKFVRLVKREKDKGKTVLMSSHMFNEIEKTCDRVAIIRSGHIVSVFDLKEIFDSDDETFDAVFKTQAEAKSFAKGRQATVEGNEVRVTIARGEVDGLLKDLGKYEVVRFSEVKKTLEQVFMNFYSTQNEKGE